MIKHITVSFQGLFGAEFILSLPLSSSKDEAEGRLRVTYFCNEAMIQRRKIRIEEYYVRGCVLI